jgi:hypothetical protein
MVDAAGAKARPKGAAGLSCPAVGTGNPRGAPEARMAPVGCQVSSLVDDANP